jgi:prolyl-tRNA synthetase
MNAKNEPGKNLPSGKSAKTAITPTRDENYPEWYQEVIKASELAENSPVRGCMVIKPWGYAIWENIQRVLDGMFKETGHKNAYFPLFIPLSFLEKEAAHVDGFAKECAVVTHHRLEQGKDGKLVPAGELDEPLVVRPTSETIIGYSFSKWVQSYRDLPLLINQWANVVRWEMRTRLFLRTTEFLWQEGHTAHATKEEAIEETLKMLGVYVTFAEQYLGMPVIFGRKTKSERFPGAEDTFCIEAMMQDRKALQAGTSHFLGQNFAKSSDIKFLDATGKEQHAWTTSWGVSTRLVGGMVMTHADDDGLRCPPKLAPVHIAILPVLSKAPDPAKVIEYCQRVAKELRDQLYDGERVRVEVDTRDLAGGDKTWQWVKRGVPIRLEIGTRDMEQDGVFMAERHKAPKDKAGMPRAEFVATVGARLGAIQKALFDRAADQRKEHTRNIDTKADFYEFFKAPETKDPNDPTPTHAGFAMTHYSGEEEVEKQIKEDLGVTVRCVPMKESAFGNMEPGTCPFTGKPSAGRVVWAKSY